MPTATRPRAEQVRDLIMLGVLLFWVTYGTAAVVQLVTSGSKVLDSLPPFYFWGIPLAPYTALYVPWKALPGVTQQPQPVPEPTPPEEPIPPQTAA